MNNETAPKRYFADKEKSEESEEPWMIETRPNQFASEDGSRVANNPEECNELLQFLKNTTFKRCRRRIRLHWYSFHAHS